MDTFNTGGVVAGTVAGLLTTDGTVAAGCAAAFIEPVPIFADGDGAAAILPVRFAEVVLTCTGVVSMGVTLGSG